jgi:hypothetical protein
LVVDSIFADLRTDQYEQAFVQINPNRPSIRLSTSGTLKNATKSSSKMTFTNADLPAACLSLWNELYVPLIFDWASTLANPWNYHNANIKDNLQTIWDIAYPNISAVIQPKQPIFVQVCILGFKMVFPSDISTFRAHKESRSGVEPLAQALLLPLRISGLPKGSKLRQDRRNMRSTCLAWGFLSRTLHSIPKKRYVVSLYVVALTNVIELRWVQDSSYPSSSCQL